MRSICGWCVAGGLALATAGSLGGCPGVGELEQLINTAADAVNRTIDNLQSQDILNLPNLGGAEVAGLNVALGDDVALITDPTGELAGLDGKTATLLAFQNDTAYHMYLSYVVNGRAQTVLVFAGETTLLRYPCIRRLLMVAEWDFDPETEEFVQGYEFRGGRFDNPDGTDMMGDYDCDDPNDFFGEIDPFDPDMGDPNFGGFDPNDSMSFDPNDSGSSDPNDFMPAQDMPVSDDPCFNAFGVDLDHSATKKFRGQETGFKCGELIVIRIDQAAIEIRSKVALE